MNNNRYTYRITWSADDNEHVGLCAEFPSLSWLASTPQKALAGIQRIVNETIEDLESNNEPIPTPFSEKSYSGQFRVRITPDLHRSLAIEAAESGVSMNHLVSTKLSSFR